MSTIKAGTTSATAIQQTGDTTGDLILESSGPGVVKIKTGGVTYPLGQSGTNYLVYADGSGKVLIGTLVDLGSAVQIASNSMGQLLVGGSGALSGQKIKIQVNVGDTPVAVFDSTNGLAGMPLQLNPSGGRVWVNRTADDGSGAIAQFNGSTSNTTGVWINVSDERVKTDIKPITGSLEKVVALAEAMAHYRYKGESGIDAGYRTGPIAQRLEKAGFEGHVTNSTADIMDEKIGALLGWEYGDEEYEEEEKYKEGDEEKTRTVKKTRRVVTKKGEALKSVENNFTPYLFPAFKELLEYTRSLEKRLTALEK